MKNDWAKVHKCDIIRSGSFSCKLKEMRNFKQIALLATLVLLCSSALSQEMIQARPIPNMALFSTDKVSLTLSDHLYAFDDFVNYEVTGTASKVEGLTRKIGGSDSTFNCEQLITPSISYRNSNYLVGLCDNGRKIVVFSAAFKGLNKDGFEEFEDFKVAKKAGATTNLEIAIPKDTTGTDPECHNLRNIDQFYSSENYVVSCKYGQKMFPFVFKFSHSSEIVDLVAQPQANSKVFDILTGDNAADELDLVYNLNCNFLGTYCISHDTFLNQDLTDPEGKKKAKNGIFLVFATVD